MQFRKRIPEAAIQGVNTSDFIDVLDALYDYKFSEISRAVKLHNPVLFLNRKWMTMQLADYGVYIPASMPVQIIQQYLLNVGTITGLRGSKIGLELWLSVLTLGEVTVDDSDYWSYPTFLLLDSKTQGTLFNDSEDIGYFLVGDTEDLTSPVSISFTIKSLYFDGAHEDERVVIEDYIRSNIKEQLGFGQQVTINFTFQAGTDFYFHKLLNSYYI